MQQEMPLVLLILVLLLASRVFGELMERMGQLAMIGEILAGVVLGPSVLGLIKPGPELKVLSGLGVFLMVMLAGMEMDFRDVGDSFRGRGALIALCGFLIPFGAGNAIGRLLGYEPTMAVFLGLCMAMTALPVSVRILMDLGRLQTGPGQRIVTAAVQDDVTSLLLLGVILGVKAKGEVLMPVVTMGLKTVAFIAVVWGVYRLVLYSSGHIPHSRKVVIWAKENLRGKETLFALTLLFILGFAALAEGIGLHFVVGTFFGAMVLSRRVLGKANYEEVERTASGMAMGFLAPIFFAAIGVEFQLSSLANPVLIVSVLVAAFVTKLIGGYLGARLAGLDSTNSQVIAWGMNGRGVMELVIADLALRNGFIKQDLFSTLVLMGMVTTVLTPALLKQAFERAERKEAAAVPDLALAAVPGEVPPALLDDVRYRRDWVQNVSGAQSDEDRPKWHLQRLPRRPKSMTAR